MRRDGTVGWEGDVPDFEGHLFSFSFFSFFLLSYLYLFEVQSVPWYAIKKRLKKASRIVRQSDVGTTKKMGMQQ